ncbi:hypothetical protein V8F20_012175 [Naviculisporaceae sp. PSN 640]
MASVDQLPPGLAPELQYNSLQVGTVISFAVTYLFCTFFLLLRYFQIFKLVKKVEPDLVVLTLAYAGGMVYFVTILKLMTHGWGRHVDEINTTDMFNLNKILLPNTITYLTTPGITKLAMVIVLFQINPSIVYRVLAVLIGLSILGYTVALSAITGGPCNPNLGTESLQCLQNVALSHAILNIVSDLAVIALPIPTIFSLNFSLRTKLTVCCMLALGSLVVVCSIARLPYVIALEGDPDVTYTQAILGIWSVVEVNLGILCGCIMRLKPLFVKYLPGLRLFSSKQATKSAPRTWTTSTKELRGTDPRKVHHTYQLHSVQKGSVDPMSEDEGGIRVQHEYDIHSDRGRVSRLDDLESLEGGTKW